VHGLGAKLVPFPAQQVRVCSYNWGGTLIATAVLRQQVAAQFEASTNRLQTKARPPTRRVLCHEVAHSLLTFTTTTQRVDVAVEDCDNGQASNGTLTVDPTRAWLDELAIYIAATEGTAQRV
jgi:hypothetical protein